MIRGLTAAVVAYEHGEKLLPTLRSLLESGIRSTIVWDNSANSEELRLLVSETVPGAPIRVTGDGANHGFGGGNNRAWAESNHSSDLLLVNPDCLMTAATLASLQDALATNDTAGIVAPLMEYPDGKLGISGGRFPSIRKELLAATRIDDLFSERARMRLIGLFDRLGRKPGQQGMADTLLFGDPIELDWVSGFCMLIRSEAIERVGLFDEDFFLYFEDVDICRRYAEFGYTSVLDRRVAAVHDESSSTGAHGKSAHFYRGLAQYMTKYGSGTDRRLARFLETTAR